MAAPLKIVIDSLLTDIVSNTKLSTRVIAYFKQKDSVKLKNILRRAIKSESGIEFWQMGAEKCRHHKIKSGFSLKAAKEEKVITFDKSGYPGQNPLTHLLGGKTEQVLHGHQVQM